MSVNVTNFWIQQHRVFVSATPLRPTVHHQRRIGLGIGIGTFGPRSIIERDMASETNPGPGFKNPDLSDEDGTTAAAAMEVASAGAARLLAVSKRPVQTTAMVLRKDTLRDAI